MENSYYYAIAFWCFTAMSVLSGLFILLSRDIVRMAFWLLATLGAFAGFYVLLGADFLAVTQIVLYVGGILILILFGIMLTKRAGREEAQSAEPLDAQQLLSYSSIGLVAFSVIFLGLFQMIQKTPWAGSGQLVQTGPGKNLDLVPPSTEVVGGLLMTDYLLPFEVASVLLLVALAGAAYIIRRREEVS